MDEAMNQFLQTLQQDSERKAQTMQKLVSAADAAKVFSPPVSAGEYTVITAAEVGAGGGFGSGMGFGVGGRRRRENADEAEVAGTGKEAGPGAGSGGGGGGGSMGRPVATIVIGPEGVEVRPVVDATKVALAALTAFGAIGALLVKMLKSR